MTTDTMEIRQLARQFAESELRPHVEQWDRDRAIPAATIAQLAELGFFSMLAPESAGGMEFDVATYAAAIEELAWGEPGAALMVAAFNASGQDAPTGAARFALVDDDAGGMLLVPTDAAGEAAATLGFRTLDIVRASADAQASDIGRIGVAAIAVGIAQAALDHARGYADVREQFRTRLREFEGIQAKLAEMATRTEAARALLQRAATVAQDERGRYAAMAKLFASDTAMFVTTEAVQIFGGYGYMKDYPVEKLMRDAKATELLEGANETLRVFIARELYR